MKVRPSGEITSPQLVAIAVYLLGGDRRYVDTEDIAYKANELAQAVSLGGSIQSKST